MNPALDLESHGLKLNWTAWPTTGDCASYTVDHYVAVINDSGTPASTTDGFAASTTGLNVTLLPHRAQRLYYGRVYACLNEDCTTVFGTGTGETIGMISGALDDKDTETTAQEEWLIVGLDPADGGLPSTAVDADANDPEVLFPPTGWTSENHLVIYAFDNDDTDKSISYARASGTGWQNFNTATYSSRTLVAGWNDSDSDYDSTSHAYVHPVLHGSVATYRLLAQNQGGTDHDHVVWADSVDDEGKDFDLTCASCCVGTTATECDWPAAETASTAGIAIPTGAGTPWLTAWHGRWIWDYVLDGAPDLSTQSPSVVFTGDPRTLGADPCSVFGGPESDIYLATWNTTSQSWVPLDADSDGCPEPIVEDAHDPAVTPLPGGEFKMYVVNASHEVETYYFDGTAWETQTATPRFSWDDSANTEVTHDCVANLASVAWVQPATAPEEGIFLFVAKSSDTFESGTCTSGSTHAGGSLSRLYFTELQN